VSADPGAATVDGLDPELRRRIAALSDEGWEIWERFDVDVRRNDWHPFVPADYERVLEALVAQRGPGLRFLEWGSATGVITIMADLLGYEAWGIELDPALVEVARGLASRYGSAGAVRGGELHPLRLPLPPRRRRRPPGHHRPRRLRLPRAAPPAGGLRRGVRLPRGAARRR
jgi:hypothetical protein